MVADDGRRSNVGAARVDVVPESGARLPEGLITFMTYDLGFFDDQCTRVECAPNPFTAKVLPMSPE
jgi:hypothetical protein